MMLGTHRHAAAGSLIERRPVHPGDPDEVFVLEANLLAQYSEGIGRDVERIKAQCSGHAELQAAAAAYLAEIGSNIPEPIIRAAVRRLTALKFRTSAGLDLRHAVEVTPWAD